MAVERVSGGSSLIDVLDRVLDKGIVIDAWVRISLVGIDLITVEARIVVASIDTYLKYADAVGLTGLVSRPQLGTGEEEEITTVETTRRPARTRRSAARIIGVDCEERLQWLRRRCACIPMLPSKLARAVVQRFACSALSGPRRSIPSCWRRLSPSDIRAR